jgi:hypothetical protein
MPTGLNNREWALLIWMAVALVLMLISRDLRHSLATVVKALLAAKIVGLFCATAAYVFVLVMLGRSLSLWTNALIGSTVLWFVGVALIMVMRSTRVSEETGFLRQKLIQAVGLAALVEGFANLYVFPLVIELILLPILFLLAGMAALAELKDEYVDVRKPLNKLLSLVGIGFLIYAVAHVASDVSGAHLGSALPKCACACRACLSPARAAVVAHRAELTGDLRSLAMPVWLTVGLLPFIYTAGLMIAYETAFLPIDLCHWADARARRRAKLVLLLGVHFRARRLGEFRAPWPYRLVREPNVRAARRVIREFCRTPSPESMASVSHSGGGS